MEYGIYDISALAYAVSRASKNRFSNTKESCGRNMKMEFLIFLLLYYSTTLAHRIGLRPPNGVRNKLEHALFSLYVKQIGSRFHTSSHTRDGISLIKYPLWILNRLLQLLEYTSMNAHARYTPGNVNDKKMLCDEK